MKAWFLVFRCVASLWFTISHLLIDWLIQRLTLPCLRMSRHRDKKTWNPVSTVLCSSDILALPLLTPLPSTHITLIILLIVDFLDLFRQKCYAPHIAYEIFIRLFHFLLSHFTCRKSIFCRGRALNKITNTLTLVKLYYVIVHLHIP